MKSSGSGGSDTGVAGARYHPTPRADAGPGAVIASAIFRLCSEPAVLSVGRQSQPHMLANIHRLSLPVKPSRHVRGRIARWRWRNQQNHAVGLRAHAGRREGSRGTSVARRLGLRETVPAGQHLSRPPPRTSWRQAVERTRLHLVGSADSAAAAPAEDRDGEEAVDPLCTNCTVTLLDVA